MSEYSNVERPFLQKLEEIGWEIINHGGGAEHPTDPTISRRMSFGEVAIRSHFKKWVGKINSWATDEQLDWAYDKITTQQKRTVANFNAGYKFTDWLSLDYTLGYNDYSQDRKNVINLGSRGYGGKGYIRKSVYNDAMLESTLLLTAEKDLMEDLNLRVTLGHNYNQETSTSFTANGPEIVNRGIYAIDNTKSQTASEAYSRARKWGVFADILLNYKNWAFLNLSGRNDVSSTLPVANNSFFYPAISASVVFTEALGIQDSFLNFGKRSPTSSSSDVTPRLII